jgi:hypothetical protein
LEPAEIPPSPKFAAAREQALWPGDRPPTTPLDMPSPSPSLASAALAAALLAAAAGCTVRDEQATSSGDGRWWAAAPSRPAGGLIGNGGVEGTFKRWDVTTVAGTKNDVWTETASVLASDYVGYTVSGGIGKRWGQAYFYGSGFTFDVSGTGPTANVVTSFDSVSGSTLAVGGDSGSALFYSISGQWVLGGITSSLLSLNNPDTSPPGGAVATGKNIGTYYNLNGYADIVNYRGFIFDTVGAASPIPEPAVATGLVGAAVLLAGLTCRRRLAARS